MTTTPIVVAVDGSEESLRAVEYAAGEARRHSAPLRIVSAPATLPRMLSYQSSPETVADLMHDVAERALSEALTRVREVAPGVLADADLLSGPPALAVTDSGAGAQMLVLGARGAGGFAAMLLGSVSRYAAMHASCPVIVAREETDAVHREVVVGLRDQHDTGPTLAFAFDEAARRGAALVMVHSWYWFPPALRGPGRLEGTEEPADARRIAATVAENLAETLSGWRDKFPDVSVRQDVVRGHPARLLASYSARADLVVIGRHGTTHTASGIGGIQHAVLNHAHGPVAVIPAEA